MSLSNPPKKTRAEQLILLEAAEKRLKEVKESILSDNTDYWDDRVLDHVSGLKYLQGDKTPPRVCPKWSRGAKVRIKGKGIEYGPNDFDVISDLRYNQLEPKRGEWTYGLWEREGNWKETELEEVFIDRGLSVGNQVRIISGMFRYFTGSITKICQDEEDGNGDLIWIVFDVNPRLEGWEDDPDPFTFSFHPYELEKI